MGANNPSEVTLAEVRQMHRHLPQVLLSIGTGLQKKKHRSHNHKKLVVAKGWRHVGKAMAYLVSQSQDTAERVYETCDSMDIPYVRWNAPGVGDVVLDEWQPPSTGELTKSKILTLTQQHLVDVHLRLVQYAKKLVEIRRRRAETERWEVFARQNVYFCPDPECHYNIAAQSFETREELREHGICAHSYITNVDIDNVENLNHACVHNECGHESIRVFPKQGDFEQHLLSDHGVKPDPVFMTPRRMEAWLDRGRMTQVQAFDRHDTEDQLKDSDKTAINGTSHHPNHDNFTNGTLRPPEVNETPQPTTPPRPTENGLGDGRVQSSKHSANAPSPARSATDTIAGASQESRERSGSVGQLRQQRTESPTPISRRSSGWQLPVTFRPLFKRTATDG
jgi:hypothetical protein